MFCASAQLVSVILKSQMAFSVLEMIEIAKGSQCTLRVRRMGLIKPRLKGKQSLVREEWGLNSYSGG